MSPLLADMQHNTQAQLWDVTLFGSSWDLAGPKLSGVSGLLVGMCNLKLCAPEPEQQIHCTPIPPWFWSASPCLTVPFSPVLILPGPSGAFLCNSSCMVHRGSTILGTA